jgi:hypothetical protein
MALAIARLSLSAITKTHESDRSDSGIGVSSHEGRLLPYLPTLGHVTGAADRDAGAPQDGERPQPIARLRTSRKVRGGGGDRRLLPAPMATYRLTRAPQ